MEWLRGSDLARGPLFEDPDVKASVPQRVWEMFSFYVNAVKCDCGSFFVRYWH